MFFIPSDDIDNARDRYRAGSAAARGWVGAAFAFNIYMYIRLLTYVQTFTCCPCLRLSTYSGYGQGRMRRLLREGRGEDATDREGRDE